MNWEEFKSKYETMNLRNSKLRGRELGGNTVLLFVFTVPELILNLCPL